MTLAVLVMTFEAAPAEAFGRRGGLVVVNYGEDVELIRPLDKPLHGTSELGEELWLGKLGYKYTRFGLFWLDLWRWDGRFIAYDGEDSFGNGGYYVELTEDEVEELGGARAPIGYWLPPLLLVILAGIELLIVSRRKRTARFALIAGVVFLVLGLILLLLGLGPAVMIPGFLGLYHIAAAFLSPAVPAADDLDAETTEPEEPPTPRPRPIERVPVPRVETDPFRAPPQHAPIHVERLSQPVVAPIAVDPNAAAPKLLR
ncbi:MAG: hypothetical protein JWP01_1629 [Myxococcales bacterium]|nr:hypothetical protein [Myxococcales bacterium]